MHWFRFACMTRLVAVAAVALTFVTTSDVPLRGSPWTIQSTPNALVNIGTLNAVSCPSLSACIAVGQYRNGAGFEVTLAETWNGRTWKLIRTPNPKGNSGLVAVSCSLPTACMAVGNSSPNGLGSIESTALAETWNGKNWAIAPTRNPKATKFNLLQAVSCSSPTFCIAIGYSDSLDNETTLSESWNGKIWTITPSPVSDVAVSCTSSKACMAVGGGLAEMWNGMSWTSALNLANSDFDGVSCTSSMCMVVGAGNSGLLAELWNGRKWTTNSPANPYGSRSSLEAVSCATPKACTATGTYNSYVSGPGVTLAETWNGRTWTITPTPNARDGTESTLEAVSCRSSTVCMAVGSYRNRIAVQVTLAESSKDRGWVIDQTLNPRGATPSLLTAVSCASAVACVALGRSFYPVGYPVPMTELSKGKSWTIRSIPEPLGATTASLTSVSCKSSNACVAVGQYTKGSSVQALAESWNGRNWTINPTPSPNGASTSSLDAVACISPATCIAVGNYADADAPNQEGLLSESWNGKSWRLISVPSPADSSSSLEAVACTSSTACTAVGKFEVFFNSHTLAESWNGRRWTILQAADPSSGLAPSLDGVSCASSTACIAVGQFESDSSSRATVTLSESWNGRVWTIRPTPNLSGALTSSLGAVSCISSVACIAVGQYTSDGPGGSETLAESWNGSKWVVIPTANLSAGGSFGGVSCRSSTSCIAVGQTAHGVEVTLAERGSV